MLGAGVVTAIGQVSGRLSMIIADARHGEGWSVLSHDLQEIIRAQMIASRRASH